MLIENYLVAVISLPAGVFNPYSGVKTSILVMDKRLSKKTDSILFAKIENDGFNLGAQRRPIDKNDLPAAARNLKAWLEGVRNDSPFDFEGIQNLHVVEKARIAENGEWNLIVDRYLEGQNMVSEYPWVNVGDVVDTITPPIKIQKTEFGLPGRFPIIDQSQNEIAGWTNDESVLIYPTKPLVIFGDHTCAVKLSESPFAQGADGIKILQTMDFLEPRYLFHVLRQKPLETIGYQRHFSKLKEYKIPLPPIEVQKEIMAEIEGYQKIIDGARQVVENYQPRIQIDPDWQIVELGEVATMNSGGTPSKQHSAYWKWDIPWVSPKDMKVDFIEITADHISQSAVSSSATRLVNENTLLCVVRSGILQHSFPVAITTRKMCFNQYIVAISSVSS